ncbi:MAG TPA: PRC-barrel domain-containing protein [Hyphomicrobiaceae bacterium]|jgi:hypothetical protein|nr:PRC-barrel domain-containing protein [Hyphomicrobiaceae bacterium]
MKTIAKALAAGLLAAALTPGTSQAQAAEQFVTVQPAGQWLTSLFVGQPVTNAAGETIGDINDLLFEKDGRIETVVIGVGGFLGVGEKNVAIPFRTLKITVGADGARVVTADLSKQSLLDAPKFTPTEKTVYMRAREQAYDLGQKALDKATELKNQAAKKIEEIQSGKGTK